MKKIIFISVFLIQVFALFAQTPAKNESNKKKNVELSAVKNVIRLNLAEVFAQTVSIHYERMLTDKVSLSVGVIGKYNSSSSQYRGIYNQSKITSGIGIMPEIRFYPIPNYFAPRGMYISGFYNYYSETYEEKAKEYDPNNSTVLVDAKGSINTTFSSIGGTLGWVFRIQNSFVIDLGFGLAFQNTQTPDTYNYSTVTGSIIETRPSPYSNELTLKGVGRFSLGYAF
ncbi:MAG: hypothetical protein WCK82_10980 [Bacteroidota bacterium]|jgi:trehalose/maltose hydrolase-like predicted phosphorylase